MLTHTLHIALATLLFATSAGATLSVHFCGGQAVKWALYRVADNCGMTQHAQPPEEPSDTPQFKRIPCCKDELSYHKLDVEQTGDLDADKLSISDDYIPEVAAFAKTSLAPPAALTANPIIRPPPQPAPQRTRRAALASYLL